MFFVLLYILCCVCFEELYIFLLFVLLYFFNAKAFIIFYLFIYVVNLLT